MDAVNHQFRLAARPDGMVGPEHFDYVEEAAPRASRRPSADQDGLYLARPRDARLDGRGALLRPAGGDRRSRCAPARSATIVESKGQKLAVGDYVTGWLGVQEYAMCEENAVFKVDAGEIPLTKYLGALGMPGVTAYFGLLDVGAPKEGETVVVSGAAGAVGSVVGQIAKIKGCRVVGIAGGPEKCAWIVDDLGFDAAIDYKGEDVGEALRKHCPEGVDVYFDNVGGEILDAALARLARGARVVICGAISQYNKLDLDAWAVQLHVAAGQPRAHGGLRRDRLHEPCPRGRRRDGRLDRRGQARSRARTSSRASRASRTLSKAVPRGERGEAGVEGLRRAQASSDR